MYSHSQQRQVAFTFTFAFASMCICNCGYLAGVLVPATLHRESEEWEQEHERGEGEWAVSQVSVPSNDGLLCSAQMFNNSSIFTLAVSYSHGHSIRWKRWGHWAWPTVNTHAHDHMQISYLSCSCSCSSWQQWGGGCVIIQGILAFICALHM